MNITIINLIGSFIEQSPYNRGQVAEFLEVSRNTVSNWCKGHTYPSVLQLIKLGDLLNVPYGEFYVVRKENQNE